MVGFIGIGRMGSNMVSALLRQFYEVQVFDIDAKRVEAAVRQGAKAASTVGDLVSACDPIFLSLPKSQILVSVMDSEVIPHLPSDKTVIDLGTTVIAETRRLAAAVAEKGSSYLDAPVSGGGVGSAAGSLFMFVGGDKAVAQAQWPVLQALGGGRLTYCGESGAGQITKAVNQLAMGIPQAAYLEAIAYGVNAGVDAATLVAAVGGTGGFRSEVSNYGNAVISDAGDGFDTKYAEHAYFLDEAKAQGFPTPLLDALYTWLNQFPADGQDNMDRPYPRFWSSVVGEDRGERPAED